MLIRGLGVKLTRQAPVPLDRLRARVPNLGPVVVKSLLPYISEPLPAATQYIPLKLNAPSVFVHPPAFLTLPISFEMNISPCDQIS